MATATAITELTWKARLVRVGRLILLATVLAGTTSLLLRPGAWQLLLRTNNPMASLENEVDIEAISTGCARFFPEFRFASTKPNFTCSFEDVVKGTVEDNTLCGGFPEPNEEAGIYLPADPDTFCNLEPIPARCLEESFRMVKSRDIPSDAPDFENDEYTPFMEYQSDRYRFALHVLEHIGCGLRYWVTQGNAISILRHGAFFGRMPSGKWDLVDSDLDINIVLPKAKSTGLTMRHLLDHLQHSGGRFSCNDKKFSGKTVHCWVLCWKGQKEYGLTQPWKHLSGGKSCLIKEYCDAEADKNCGAVELKLVRDPTMLQGVFPLQRVWSGLPPRQEYPVWVAGNIMRDAQDRSALVGSACLPLPDKPLNGPNNMPALARKHCDRYKDRLSVSDYTARCERAPRLSSAELSELVLRAQRLHKKGLPSFLESLTKMLTERQFGGCADQMPDELPDLQVLIGSTSTAQNHTGLL